MWDRMLCDAWSPSQSEIEQCARLYAVTRHRVTTDNGESCKEEGGSVLGAIDQALPAYAACVKVDVGNVMRMRGSIKSFPRS